MNNNNMNSLTRINSFIDEPLTAEDTEKVGSDGFPTEEEYERMELELGGPVIHCGGGRWKLESAQ